MVVNETMTKMKLCPVCKEKWKDHWEEGQLIVSPQAYNGPPTHMAVLANACYVRFSTYQRDKRY